jgi:hypothetical protein
MVGTRKQTLWNKLVTKIYKQNKSKKNFRLKNAMELASQQYHKVGGVVVGKGEEGEEEGKIEGEGEGQDGIVNESEKVNEPEKKEVLSVPVLSVPDIKNNIVNIITSADNDNNKKKQIDVELQKLKDAFKNIGSKDKVEGLRPQLENEITKFQNIHTLYANDNEFKQKKIDQTTENVNSILDEVNALSGGKSKHQRKQQSKKGGKSKKQSQKKGDRKSRKNQH